MKNNILVKRKTSFGDYEFVTLEMNYIRDKEENGFPAHISWKVDNGDNWHFESLTQFLNQSLEDFLKKNEMELIEMIEEKEADIDDYEDWEEFKLEYLEG